MYLPRPDGLLHDGLLPENLAYLRPAIDNLNSHSAKYFGLAEFYQKRKRTGGYRRTGQRDAIRHSAYGFQRPQYHRVLHVWRDRPASLPEEGQTNVELVLHLSIRANLLYLLLCSGGRTNPRRSTFRSVSRFGGPRLCSTGLVSFRTLLA